MTGDFDRAKGILVDPLLAIDDLREGERSLSHLWQVLHEGKDPRRAVIDLMTRDAKGELDGLGLGVQALLGMEGRLATA